MVAIIGLGYVGLPLALLSAKKGKKTIGFDINHERIDELKNGRIFLKDSTIIQWYEEGRKNITFTSNENDIESENIKIICVPTPVNENKEPDFNPLISATKIVSKHLNENDLVIVESTISPGTMENVVKPILDKTKKNYYLAHCPERIDPGNKRYNVSNIPRNVGGINLESTRIAADFYRSILDAEVKELSSIRAAEATKIMENSFRDVNIAFINEMAKIFQKMDIDVLEVIEGAKTKPFGFLAHYPGIGVGGHCIAVDPYYLIKAAKSCGVEPKILETARETNRKMPLYAFELMKQKIKTVNIEDPVIGVLGIAYKQDVRDDRESPYYDFIALLKESGYHYHTYDPFFREKSDYDSLEELQKNVNVLVIVTAHSEFRNMNIMDNIKLVVDGRNILNEDVIKAKGIDYVGIGRN